MSESKIKMGLLFGGDSVEHAVSVVSARGIAQGFNRERIECVPLAVTETGRWLSPQLSMVVLQDGRTKVEVDDTEDDGIGLLVDPGKGGILQVYGDETALVDLDVVFPIIHGWGGEDGRIQALLELAGIPYVGSGVCGSAVAMDKDVAKTLVASGGVAVAPWLPLRRHDFQQDPERTIRTLAAGPGLPMFVKPANGGSSVGISRVDDMEELRAALDLAFEHDCKAVVEKGLDAREIECAVLGNHEPQAAVPGEIVPAAEFYTYEDKYVDGAARLVAPAELDVETGERVRNLAVKAFKLLGLAGMARVDFLLEKGTGQIYFNEANSLPGFTPISMYSKLWEASGVSYAELLDRLVDLALERAKE